MKKLVFLFAMVFAVSMAMAQKTTWVTQSGNGNVAEITQEACTSGHATSIFAVQSGEWNSLTTMQTGDDNYLELKQTGFKNSAVMEQFTCDAANSGEGGVNNADIYQSGDGNTANLTQQEENILGEDWGTNTAHATQSGDNNSYILKQGGARTGYPVSSQYLTQSGDGNSAGIDQIGYKLYSEIVQTGDWNTADLNQNARYRDGSSFAKSYSWQLGHKNTLDIKQVNDASEELVESVQNGTSNTTNVTQENEWVGGSQDVYSTQKGTGDIISVKQID